MKKMILSRVTLLQLQKCCIPFLIGATIGLTLYTFAGWWGFLLIFPWIGFSITLGCLIAIKRKGIKKDLGRRICLLMISPLFLLFLGICQRENLQLEEFVFYLLLFLQTGMIVRVFIHFCIAKIFGPFIWGRGFCGWACWTAALMEWLPIKENRKTPTHLTRYRYLALIINIGIPLSLVWLGYDWVSMNINELPSDHIWLVQGSLALSSVSSSAIPSIMVWQFGWLSNTERGELLQNSLSSVFIHEMSNQSFVNTTHPIRQPLHFVWNLQQALSNGCQRDVVHIRRQESEIQRMYPMRNVLKRMP